MIKSHRPRGHYWTHASRFQQTQDFRSINVEECRLVSAKVLAQDEDDLLLHHERVAKRRRIEKLADDFLNGQRLPISSARPCSQTLRSVIVWNKKSDTEPKFSFPPAEPTRRPGLCWDEAEDDKIVLAKFIELSRRRTLPLVRNHDASRSRAAAISEVACEEAQARCRSSEKSRRRRVACRSSTQTIEQPSTVDSHHAGGASTEEPVVVRRSARLGERPQQISEPKCGSLQRSSQKSEDRRRVDTWLSRRKSRFSFTAHDEDEDAQSTLQAGNAGCGMRDVAVRDGWRENCPASRPAYISIEASQDQVTPFMFRKKEPDSLDERAELLDRKKARRRVTFDPLASVTDDLELDESSRPRQTASSLPTVDIGCGEQPFVAPEPDKDLVKIHLNTVLSAKTSVAPRSSAVKKALKHALRTAGAEFSKCESEPASSSLAISQPDRISSLEDNSDLPGLDNNAAATRERLATSPNLWPGTQAALFQAENALCISPEKQVFSATTDSPAVFEAKSKSSIGTSPRGREPLRKLSQEPAPSTQVLLDAFGGWSTIKKPHSTQPRPSVATPTLVSKSRWPAMDTWDADRGAEASNLKCSAVSEGFGLEHSLLFTPSSMPDMTTADRCSDDNPRLELPTARSTDIRHKRGVRSNLSQPLSLDDLKVITAKVSLQQSFTIPSNKDFAAPSPDTSMSLGQKCLEPQTGTLDDLQCVATHRPDDDDTFVTSFANFVTDDRQESSHAAQAPASLPIEDSDPYRAVEDLTTNFFNSAEMMGVLSQVG